MKKHFLIVLTGLFMIGCASTTNKTTYIAVPNDVKDNDAWEEAPVSAVEPEDTCTHCGIINQQKEMQEIIQKIIEKGETIPVPSFQPPSVQ